MAILSKCYGRRHLRYLMLLTIVMSTQSLLLAIGLGASSSLKVAATFQWVIKDALGQIGGILAAGVLGNFAPHI